MSNLNNDYKSIMVATCNFGTDLYKKKVLKALGKQNEDLIDVIMNEENQVELDNMIKKIEKCELELNFAYNFLFEISNFDETIELIKDSYFNNYINNKEIDFLNYQLEKPKIIISEDKIEFKFSKIIKNENGKKIKNIVLLVFYLEEKYIQIKIQYVPNNFQLNYKNESYYLDVLEETINWAKTKLNLNLRALDIFPNAKDIFKDSFFTPEKLEGVTPVTFSCNNQKNGKIKINVDNENIMPILFELKEIKNKFKDEKDKEILQGYLNNLIITADYYKIDLEWIWKWRGEKNQRLRLSFVREYLNKENTLIYFMANNIEKEKRKNVIKFVATYRKESKE